MADTFEVVIVGGGVIGLSLARELARQARVAVVDRGRMGREASWAGAGILPPASIRGVTHPLDQLRALSFEGYADWSEELLAETQIDIGFRRSGGLYVARSPGEVAALRGQIEVWQEEHIEVQRLDLPGLCEAEPALTAAVDSGRIRAACRLPQECQVRNPRLLRALAESCRRRGAALLENTDVLDFILQEQRVMGLMTTTGPLAARQLCITAGAWTYLVLQRLGITTGILPIRGQMVLLAGSPPLLRHIINEGPRYLVPRDDGRILVGSTEEEAGYSSETTPQAIAELTRFAYELVPSLTHTVVERTWAGLRPGSFDGFPYLGRVPGFDNLFVAAGHFRSGLSLAPATAQVMAQLMRGETPSVNLTPFSVLRH
jgi:glycine oxidase